MKTNTVRVISGTYKGRKLKFPSINGLRPTSDQMKECVFNWLLSYVNDSICVDAFAGSGSLGIEAISRGAKKSYFCEINFKAISQIKENLNSLSINNYQILKKDSLKILKELNTENNQYILFLDPPFNKNILSKALKIIIENENINQETIIYIEAEKSFSDDLLNNFEILKSKKTSNVFSALIKKKI